MRLNGCSLKESGWSILLKKWILSKKAFEVGMQRQGFDVCEIFLTVGLKSVQLNEGSGERVLIKSPSQTAVH
jgi:hypothetical protein